MSDTINREKIKDEAMEEWSLTGENMVEKAIDLTLAAVLKLLDAEIAKLEEDETHRSSREDMEYTDFMGIARALPLLRELRAGIEKVGK